MALPTTYDIQGRTVGFPIEVRDARMANAVYSVPASAVPDVIGDQPFELAVDDNGVATVVLGFVDYRDNDLGDYDEVLFSVMARSSDGVHDGTYIWRLPVNQEFTCEAGVRMLGLPKSVEDITIERTEASTTCSLRVDGELVLRQTFPLLLDATPMPMPTPTICLSTVDGIPCVSTSDPSGNLRMAFDADGYTLELGDHPWAKELRSIGIADTAPSVITVCDDWRCTFDPPRPLGATGA